MKYAWRVSARVTVVVLLLLVGGTFSAALAAGEAETKPVTGGKSALLSVISLLDGVSMNAESAASPFQPPGHGGTPPGQGGTPPGQTTPPGQGGTPPGQQGTAPGQQDHDDPPAPD